MLLVSIEDFFNNYPAVGILILLSIILAIIYVIKHYIFPSKLNEPEVEQTQEEIVKQEMDRILVTEEYKPVPKKKRRKIEDEEENDSAEDNHTSQ